MFTYRILPLCYLLLQIYPAHFTGITRLECRYSANFSVRQHHKRYDDSPILKHQNIKKLSECIVLCVVSITCGFVNYHSETFICELMYSYEYFYYDKLKLKSAMNWVFSASAFSRQQMRIFFNSISKQIFFKNIEIANKTERYAHVKLR